MKKFLSKFFGTGSSVLRIAIMSIVFGVIIVSFYFMLSKRLSSNEEVTANPKDELSICLSQDFDTNYPQSPRDVVRWYNRIQVLFYSADLSNDEIGKLCDQARKLLDSELLANNTRDNYVAGVKQEISANRQRGWKIVSTDEGSYDNVKHKVVNGDEMAYVTSYYFIQENSSYTSQYQTYALRRDGRGFYRIIAFRMTDDKGNVVGDGR